MRRAARLLAPRQLHFVCVIQPFPGQPKKCERISLEHKAMMAGQRTLRGLCRRSRLGKRCTWAECPRLASAALGVLLRPTRAIKCLVCLCWRSGDSEGRRKGGGRGAPTLTRVLAID